MTQLGVSLTVELRALAWVPDQKRTGGPVLPLSLGSPERFGSPNPERLYQNRT
jgi:hypothetical protein